MDRDEDQEQAKVDGTDVSYTNAFKIIDVLRVENFSKNIWTEGKEVSKDFFAAEDKNTIFKLSLFPNGETYEDRGYVSLFLQLMSQKESKPLLVRAVVSVVELNLTETNGKIIEKTFNKGDRDGFSLFIARHKLISSRNYLLVQDSVLFRVEISYLPVPFPESLSLTTVGMPDSISVSHMWKIGCFTDFSWYTEQHLWSRAFPTITSDVKWKLLLYPRGDTYDSYGYVSIFMCPADNFKDKLPIKCVQTFSIVDSEDHTVQYSKTRRLSIRH